VTAAAERGQETLYAYVEGADLADIAPVLHTQVAALLSSRRWACEVWLVDQQYEDDRLKPGDLPYWDLGVNLAISPTDQEGYQQDLVALYRGLAQVGGATGRTFVLGLRGEDCVSTAERLSDQELLQLLG